MITLAAPPAWLAGGKFQILDDHAMIAVTRRIARLRTSGSMPVVQTMETIYRKHAQKCPFDAANNRLTLPRQIAAAFAPLPCAVTITRQDGHLTLRKTIGPLPRPPVRVTP
ncbi:hypothetical protein [Pararhodobacter sp.]|uniref:hypothetical protein n=1 Tax=Pararhodobacter sp. TaxID=2127056 RepID=UPI002AFFAC00|nr:hypothetical protein [Pararhodobacter sp.]